MGQCSLYCQHHGGQELGVSGMVNESELLINVVMHDELKMLRSSNQKVSGQVQRVNGSLTWLLFHRRKRQHLTYSGTHAERGKPIHLPMRESNSQEQPIDVWAWDNRKSEGFAVMARIRIATLSGAKASRPRCWSLWTRTDAESTSERKANVGSSNTSLCVSHYIGRCGQHHYLSGRSRW